LWAASTIAIAIFVTAGCRGSHETMLIDLVRELPRAQVQAPAASPGARADLVPSASGPVPALVMSAPSRVTWTLQFTERAELSAQVALTAEPGAAVGDGVTLRIGISDNRSYDELFRMRLDKPAAGAAPAWRPILLDLSAFSGRKWSLFYQPSRMHWKVILNADATPGGTVAWQGLVVRARSS
jgi:hypothetical protein